MSCRLSNQSRLFVSAWLSAPGAETAWAATIVGLLAKMMWSMELLATENSEPIAKWFCHPGLSSFHPWWEGNAVRKPGQPQHQQLEPGLFKPETIKLA
jgi:hypothetical protein